ncbi:hypothetical protein TCAL_15310 [Tigriopus californicus]|uniref:Uncharacterized protein n=1 Tax=Tigriopus californicus TaxID=6832 RepID=A0A553PKN7_TIGCA|nr:hypothetical protein TCAL_15310 [Tigriopus californicus]
MPDAINDKLTEIEEFLDSMPPTLYYVNEMTETAAVDAANATASYPAVGDSPARTAQSFTTQPAFAVSFKIPKFTPTNPTWRMESMRAGEASASIFSVESIPTADPPEDILGATHKVLSAHQQQPQDHGRQCPKKKEVTGKKLPNGSFMQANGQVLCRFHAQRVAMANIPVVVSLCPTAAGLLETADSMILPKDFYTPRNSIKIADTATGNMWMADPGPRRIKVDSVSIDRLKPAFGLNDVIGKSEDIITQSGRLSKKKSKY